MTNQTIPPCPLCGTVPEVDAQFDDECKPRCGHIRSPVATIMIDDWTHSCNYELGRACRELGIETVEQLKARLAPDPRVAVLEAELQAERVINQTISECQGAGGNECQCNVHILTRTIKTLGKENCDLHDKLIAAQRGEGG